MRKLNVAIAEAISGNNSNSIYSPPYVKCFTTTRHSTTDPNVAAVAIILSTVPIRADRTREEDCTGGDGRLLFVFCFFAAIADPVGPRSFDLTGRSPSDLFPIVGSILSRGCG
jgi:hypothetical protein